MKTLKNLLLAEKCGMRAPKTSRAGKVVRFMLVIFMLSWISVLTSCAVEMRTPSPGISVETHNHGWRHNRGERHDNGRHRGNEGHNDNDQR